ncbi:SRPBCC family protein [Pseudomonas massiliensis]|uniref:SRPBCC family protein n=1 Tax=Pseudomonas massiliensis TaxID=522492 RepID=UPI00058E874D|nr:SRPBCC family protein [Pseudomonas massiliensis]
MATRPTLASSKADQRGPNLSQPERMLSMAGGGALLLNGLRAGGLKGGLQLALGGWTLWRGYKGRCELKAAVAHTPMEQEWEAETGWASSKVVSRSITVNKPVEEVIAWCRDPANIGPLIPWVDSIEQTGPDTYRWSVRGPGERTFGWTLVQSEPEAGRALRWNTPGEGVWQHEADARFSPAPQGQGTEIRLVLATEPPKGAPGYALASLISRFTHKALLYLLRALKQQMETGEIATSRGRNGERDFLFIHPDHRGQAESPVAGETLEGGIH